MSRRDYCARCAFWARNWASTEEMDATDKDGQPVRLVTAIGECRERPPVLVGVPTLPVRSRGVSDEAWDATVDQHNDAIVGCTRFPKTSSLEWCGRFKLGTGYHFDLTVPPSEPV